ncbi:MAG TPA: ester cyclase [Candidatus Limnocylindria bacterium]|jgi:predicted SnoaL-like aldol condensation-catalyzing enzyme|nr:ester cyclase [Candidatus Limnocylindria bacterium]
MSAENKELIRRVTDEIYSQGNLDPIDRYYAPDWVLHDAPPNAGENRQALKEVMTVIRGGFPDVRARIDVVLAEGDLVAYRSTVEGTHTREYFGLAPTGKKVTLHQLNIDRIRDGKIVESWFEAFGQGFYYQLTGKPAPVPAEATAR